MINDYGWEELSEEIHKIVENYVLKYGGVEIELSNEEIIQIFEACMKYWTN